MKTRANAVRQGPVGQKSVGERATALPAARPEYSTDGKSFSEHACSTVLSAPHFQASHVQAPGGRSKGTPRAEASDPLTQCLARGRRRLLALQHEDAHWCAELEGDSILQSEYILLEAWLDRLDLPEVQGAARYLLRQQAPDGGWTQYPGGPIDISASVKAYFALKLTGHDPRSEPMRRARRVIREHGGADAVNSFTRFYLALLGQISYAHCPAVPPEAVLLPRRFPLNIYRVSAWSRTIFVPLSIMWSHRPARVLPAEAGIQELFLRPPDQWPALRCPGREGAARAWSWESFFRTVDAAWKWADRWGLRPLRRRALGAAQRWMVERFEESDGLGAIFPPIVWSIVALKCLGYSDDSEELVECHRQLRGLMIHEGETTRLQPCKSPVWDTAIGLRALVATGHAETSHAETSHTDIDNAGCADGAERFESTALRAAGSTAAGRSPASRAVSWLLDKEVRRRGDWSRNVRAEPGGWFFEYRNAFYPDVDDTIMVMMALREASRQSGSGGVAEACERGRQWILAMQNRDGGWGAFDKDNDCELLCQVPFADHNAMIDPSTPDITGRVLEALAAEGLSVGDAAVERAIRYLRGTQESDGSWIGRWGVNYIYGTWQVLVGLVAAGVPRDDPAVVRGAEWLLRFQQAGGGWGESADSYARPELRGQGPVTASQTAWALLGLLAAGYADHPAVARGVGWLQQQQQADGGWRETEFTGTGFPLVFYLRYHLYPLYFPLLALGQYAAWRSHQRTSEQCSEATTTAPRRPLAPME